MLERKLINETSGFCNTIGITGTFVICKIKYKQIKLACKSVYVKKRLVIGQAIDEVAHLKQTEYTHVIHLMGPYALVREISMLMYSLAGCHLNELHKQL